MAYSNTAARSAKTYPREKNRVWEKNPPRQKFAYKIEPQALELHRKNGARSTKSASGVLYYGYRYYNSNTGRWLSRDPIAERGGVNLYGMLGNDAVNLIDLLGRGPVFQENGSSRTGAWRNEKGTPGAGRYAEPPKFDGPAPAPGPKNPRADTLPGSVSTNRGGFLAALDWLANLFAQKAEEKVASLAIKKCAEQSPQSRDPECPRCCVASYSTFPQIGTSRRIAVNPSGYVTEGSCSEVQGRLSEIEREHGTLSSHHGEGTQGHQISIEW